MTRHRIVLLALLVLVAFVPALVAQTIVRSFDGEKGLAPDQCDSALMRCGRQPEPNVAVNGTQAVQVTWRGVNVYDYNGTLLRSTPFTQFIHDAGLDPMPPERRPQPTHGPFEPLVAFNPFIQRWIMSVTCRSDCFLVSASPDALGPWKGVYLTCLHDGPCLNVDPALHIGYDKNGVYYCGGHEGDEHPLTVPQFGYDCLAISSAEVKAVANGIPPEHLNRMHNLPLDIMPAIDDNPNKALDAPAFFAAKTCTRAESGGCQRSRNFPFEWIIDTFTWNGPTGTWNAVKEQILKTDAGSKQDRWLYNLPCCGTFSAEPQKGSDIGLRAAESHRLINLVQDGAHLYGALGSGPCTADCGAQGVDANNIMFYVDVDCSKLAACVVSQTAKVGGPASNPIFGTLGVDAHGNVGIAALSSQADGDLSILLWTRTKGDPPNTLSGPTVVMEGTQPYACPTQNNVSLIANAVGIHTTRDPLDPTKLWTTQQYGGDSTRCVWNTRIFEYQVGEKAATTTKK